MACMPWETTEDDIAGVTLTQPMNTIEGSLINAMETAHGEAPAGVGSDVAVGFWRGPTAPGHGRVGEGR